MMTTKVKLITTLKIWLVIYPSITLFLFLFGQPLAVLPLYQRTLLLTIVLVPWMVFAALPALNWIISRGSIKSTQN
jgi:antibiotic biosynthesis monooxygenase (ABM) superfamily enzyme